MPEALDASTLMSTPPSGGANPNAAPSIAAASMPKPGSAMGRMFAAADKKAGITAPESTRTAPPKADTTPPAEPKPKPPETTDPAVADDQQQQNTPAPEETTPPQEDPNAVKPKRESPWKLVDTYKTRNKALEKEIADLKAKIAPENDYQLAVERAEKAEKALNESQEFIRLHKFERSQEYLDKYQKPYEAAWAKAAKKMSEISVVDPGTGQERPASINDMEIIVNAPLGRARKMAEEIFGSFANDAMTMREKIVELYEAQAEAIASAKKNGAERERMEAEKAQREHAKFSKEITQLWAKANEEIMASDKHGVYLKPREGNTDADKEWNGSLQKATEFVDKVLATLTPAINPRSTSREVLEETVKQHAALRNRAIAYSPLRKENARLQQELTALRTKLKSINESVPPAGQGAPRQKSGAPVRAIDRIMQNVDKAGGMG